MKLCTVHARIHTSISSAFGLSLTRLIDSCRLTQYVNMCVPIYSYLTCICNMTSKRTSFERLILNINYRKTFKFKIGVLKTAQKQQISRDFI
jgi:hypothetical protein